MIDRASIMAWAEQAPWTDPAMVEQDLIKPILFRLGEVLDWMPDRVTKLRALYQRKKGRDLFDLQVALDKESVDAQKVMECYNRYMDFSVEKPPSYKQFMQNMEQKMQDSEFLGDTELLLRPDAGRFEPEHAFQMVRDVFIERLPGRRR